MQYDKIKKSMIEKLEKSFDEKEMLLTREVKTVESGSHHYGLTVRKIHLIYDSLCYACCLFETGKAEKAVEIVKKALLYQDRDKTSRTYGVFQYCVEEPLDIIPSPDINQADFCAKELIYIYLYYSKHFSDDDLMKIVGAVECACEEIMVRDVYFDYTNISIMSVYVLRMGGKITKRQDIYDFSKDKLKRLYEYNAKCGNFVEYNSPTYTGIAIEDVSRMLRDFRDEECVEIAKKLNYMLWRTVAVHFHRKTKQWAGPHGRAYSDFTTRNLSFIKFATKGKIDLIADEDTELDPSWNELEFYCPEEFYKYFTDDIEPTVEKCICNADTEKFYIQEAYSLVEKEYTLSSFSFSDMWNQRRVVIGYFGNNKCIKMKFLHDGFDYASAVLNSAQNMGHIAGVVNFCTDGGDTHMNLDTGKRLFVNDLRLRLEIIGCVPRVEVIGKNEFLIDCKEIKFYYKVPMCFFEGKEAYFELITRKDSAAIDFVFYNGVKKEFSQNNKTYAAFSLDVDTCQSTEVTEKENTVIIRHGDMTLEAGIIPSPIRYLSQQRKTL